MHNAQRRRDASCIRTRSCRQVGRVLGGQAGAAAMQQLVQAERHGAASAASVVEQHAPL